MNTEGAIAKYMATEAGDLAADASIQALGGYGYTHEYMVEKIRRDVRITTIYEGTSEIMEMTISRDRWQLHLKTRGQHYHDQAREFEALHAQHPDVGADIAALAVHALAEVMEKARVARLTRYQHILLRLGELIAYAECAGSLARRAALHGGRPAERESQRSLRRDGAGGAQPDLRARGGAQGGRRRACAGSVGAGGVSDSEMAAFEVALGLPAIHRAQAGLIADMDYIADVLYNRVAKREEHICPGRGREIRTGIRLISQRSNVSPKDTGVPSWKTLLIERSRLWGWEPFCPMLRTYRLSGKT